jgi:hypothetical protein
MLDRYSRKDLLMEIRAYATLSYGVVLDNIKQCPWYDEVEGSYNEKGVVFINTFEDWWYSNIMDYKSPQHEDFFDAEDSFLPGYNAEIVDKIFNDDEIFRHLNPCPLTIVETGDKSSGNYILALSRTVVVADDHDPVPLFDLMMEFKITGVEVDMFNNFLKTWNVSYKGRPQFYLSVLIEESVL